MRHQLMAVVGSVAILAAAGPSFAGGFCLSFDGCEPKNYQECVEQAADKGKTDTGTKALISECQRFNVTDAICKADAERFAWERNHPNAAMEEIRKKVPSLAGLDDDQAIEVLHEVYYPEMPVAQVASRAGVQLHPDRSLCRRFHADLYR